MARDRGREHCFEAYLSNQWVGLAVFAAAVLSYLFLTDLSPNAIGGIEAFAAGAILAMLADSMVPEAFAEGGFTVGLFTVLGFLVAFIVARCGG